MKRQHKESTTTITFTRNQSENTTPASTIQRNLSSQSGYSTPATLKSNISNQSGYKIPTVYQSSVANDVYMDQNQESNVRLLDNTENIRTNFNVSTTKCTDPLLSDETDY